MLSNEMSHRVKNLFAIAAALTVIASRSADTPKEMARDLADRLIALGQAHSLLEQCLGFFAVFIATINVVGGFVVTERMLDMFKPEQKAHG